MYLYTYRIDWVRIVVFIPSFSGKKQSIFVGIMLTDHSKILRAFSCKVIYQ